MIGGKISRICILPRVAGVGGMVSFQRKLQAGLKERNIEVSFDLLDRPYELILVVGGTRQLLGLWRAQKTGIPIVQRLDGMNWLHRLPKVNKNFQMGWRHYLRAEYGNLILRWIRDHLTNLVVYQSNFVQQWWERTHGLASSPSTVIYNGVDLQIYTPQGSERPPQSCCRVLLVEGSLMGGYEHGLQVAMRLASGIASNVIGSFPNGVELMIVGRVAQDVRKRWDDYVGHIKHKRLHLTWVGQVPQERIPIIDRTAHLLYSIDINPACPNSVIEALACGLPVLAFDTGALPEIVTGYAGRVVPYGGDPWRLEEPDVDALVLAAGEILDNQEQFGSAARSRAEESFGLGRMVEAYLEEFSHL